MEGRGAVCCVCQDTDDVDHLEPCTCGMSTLLVHRQCVLKKQSTASKMPPAKVCIVCGGEALENGSCKHHDEHNDASSKQTGNNSALKCPSKSAQAAAGESISPAVSKESDSGKSAVLGRRFNDTPAIVPIKKRRIQIAEVIRSPSPPPRSPSPQAISSNRSVSASATSPSQACVIPCSTSSDGRSQSSKFQAPSQPTSPYVSATESHTLKRSSCGPVLEANKQNPFNSNKTEKMSIPIEEHEAVNCTDECQSVDQAGGHSNEGYCKDKCNSLNNMAQDGNNEDPSQEKLHEEIQRSESGSISKDDRLHWDLNTEMTAWDTLAEQETGKNVECESAETPYTRNSRDSEDSSHGKRTICHVDADTNVDHELSSKMEYHNRSRNQGSEQEPMDDCSSVKQEASPLVNQNGCEAEGMTYNSEYDNCDLASNLSEIHGKSEIQDREDASKVKSLAKLEKHTKSDDMQGWNNISEEPEGEEHVDYGDSEFRDADEMTLDVDDRTSLMQTDVDWKIDGMCTDEFRNQSTMKDDALSDGDETPNRASSHEDGVCKDSQEDQMRPGRRSRPTGWDQLPEGFDNAEEALKAMREIASRRGGRPAAWASSAGRGNSTSNRIGPIARDGYSATRGDGYYRDRNSDDNLNSRDSFNRGRRPDDGFSGHNAARGRNPGRTPGMYGRARVSGWGDTQNGPMNQWGPGRQRQPSGFGGPGGAAGMLSSARVESGGFIVTRDNVGKSGSAIGPSRGGMRPMVGGSNRGGRAPLLQVGRGSVDMDAGVHYSIRTGDRISSINGGRSLGPGAGGPGILGGMHDRTGPSSRGLADRYHSGDMDSRRSVSPRRPSHRMDNPNIPNRMPSLRPESRIVRSRTPPSSHHSVTHSDYAPIRSQHSPPSRWATDKREDSHRDRDNRRSHIHSQRTSPHVVTGSSLTDERDRQVLAGARRTPPMKGLGTIKSIDNGLDGRRSRRIEEELQHVGQSKEPDFRRYSPREEDKDKDKGISYRRDRDREESRRDSYRSSSKDERSIGGHRHPNTRDTDDDVAPRRRRPS